MDKINPFKVREYCKVPAKKIINRKTSLEKKANKSHNLRILTPLFGTLVFVCLYVIATFYYPGGSQADKNAKGFSWTQNYWCNLLNENAINGQQNPARPIAITAMFVLCLTFAIFCFIFPRYTGLPKKSLIAIQISGIHSMATGMFLFTNLHDIIINVASLFGFVAIAGIFAGLRKLKWRKLFWLGIFNLALVALNNILYYGNGLRVYLPVVQKITFLFFLLWMCLTDIQLFSKINSK